MAAAPDDFPCPFRWNTATIPSCCKQRRSPGCTLRSQMHVPRPRTSSSSVTKRPTPQRVRHQKPATVDQQVRGRRYQQTSQLLRR